MAKNATSEQSLIKKVWNMATVLAVQPAQLTGDSLGGRDAAAAGNDQFFHKFSFFTQCVVF